MKREPWAGASPLPTGSPVSREVLPNATVNILIKERNQVFTFHPQTEALLQCFEMGASSNAIDGAFSFPMKLPFLIRRCPVLLKARVFRKMD
jgi:hypothetical protein